MVDSLGNTSIDALITFGTNTAIQTTLRFRNSLRFVKTDADFLEVGFALFRFHERIFFTGNLGYIGNIGLISQIFGPVFLAAGFHILAAQITINGLGRFLTGKYCFNDCSRTRHDITTGENPRFGCGKCHRISGDIIPLDTFIKYFTAEDQ